MQPYLHQSRHNHATRRIRGAGGRFLTAQEARALELSGELSGNSNSGAASSQPSDSQGQADSRNEQLPAHAASAHLSAEPTTHIQNGLHASGAAPSQQNQLAQNMSAAPAQPNMEQAMNGQLAAGAAVRVQ